MKSLWKTVWRFLKKLKIELPHDPSISLLDSHPKELKVWRLRKQKEFLNYVMFPLCSFFLYFVSIRKYQVDIRDQGWGSQGFCKIRFWAVGLRRVTKATMQSGWGRHMDMCSSEWKLPDSWPTCAHLNSKIESPSYGTPERPSGKVPGTVQSQALAKLNFFSSLFGFVNWKLMKRHLGTWDLLKHRLFSLEGYIV